MNKIRRIICLAVIIVLVLVAFGCGEKEVVFDNKPDFGEVVTTTEGIAHRTIQTTLDVSLIFYDAQGNPCRIREQLRLTRKTDGETLYIYAELETAELSDFALSFLKLMNTLSPLGDIYEYLTGAKYVAFRAALHGDDINAQIQLCTKDTEPTFVYSTEQTEITELEGMWAALKYSDFVSYKAQMEDVPTILDTDLAKEIFDVLALPIEWSELSDATGDKTISVNKEPLYPYDLTYSPEQMSAFIQQTIEDMLSELWEERDPEWYEEIKGHYYETYKDTVLGMLTIDPYRVVAHSDTEGRLRDSTTTFGVTGVLRDATVLEILTEEGVEEEDIKRAETALAAIHLYISNSEKIEKTFEASVKISLSETYSYDPVVFDYTDSIFTPVDTDEPARVVTKLVYDEEKERYDWELINMPEFDDEDETPEDPPADADNEESPAENAEEPPTE